MREIIANRAKVDNVFQGVTISPSPSQIYVLYFIILKQESGMWQDALRVCKEYVPHKLQQLQDEYDREMTSNSTR
jgi:hypothetical protein